MVSSLGNLGIVPALICAPLAGRYIKLAVFNHKMRIRGARYFLKQLPDITITLDKATSQESSFTNVPTVLTEVKLFGQ